jgi:hypothetical protein
MRPYAVLGLAMIACFGLGAAAVQALHAQTKPPLYQVTEIDVTDLDGYLKEYAPKAQASANAAGGRILAAGQEVSAIEGTRRRNDALSSCSGTAWTSFKLGAIRRSTSKIGRSATNTRPSAPSPLKA